VTPKDRFLLFQALARLERVAQIRGLIPHTKFREKYLEELRALNKAISCFLCIQPSCAPANWNPFRTRRSQAKLNAAASFRWIGPANALAHRLQRGSSVLALQLHP